MRLGLEQSTANDTLVLKGDKYRITVLTERLVRLEFNDNGIFEDYPTELVWNRNFEKPEFKVEEDNKDLKIITRYFELEYKKNKKFYGGRLSPASNLKISLLNSDRVWYYTHPEIKNYGSAVYKEKNDKAKRMQKGLLSLDGFASIDDSKSDLIMEDGSFKKRDTNGIDIYVFLYNKDYYLTLADYFKLTGNPSMLPRYALGTWWCKKENYTGIQLTNLVKKFENHNIPVSIFTLNGWDNDDYKFNNNITDPKALIYYLNQKNIKLCLNIKDKLEYKPNDPNYEVLKEFIAPNKFGTLENNFYDDGAVKGYLENLIKPLNDMGISGYNITTFNKKDLQRLMMMKHYICESQNNRALVSSYNTGIASHRYSVLFSGESKVEFESLKSIPGFNNSGFNSGLSYWSHDFGGTSGGIEDSELFVRFVELGVFSPIFRLGSDSGKYYKREPWRWGIEPTKIATEFINLRYRLIPYIYTEIYKYYKHGKPLIEPIYYRYPSIYDDTLYLNEYYFGSDFFIAPILEKKNLVMDRVIHRIFIPNGIWYDFFSGKKYIGDKKYVSFYKEEEYPVFVKAGTIIPMSLSKFNDVSNPKSMEIQVFPGRSNTYSIYEDDGITNGYKDGNFVITNIEYLYKPNSYSLTILPVAGKNGVIPEHRNYRIVFRNTKLASKVQTYVDSEQVTNNTYVKGNDLIVEASNIDTSKQFTIIVSGQNIEIDEMRIVNDDIISIISDLPIETILKQKIDDIMFSKELDIKKKRIQIRKLEHVKPFLDKKYVQLFLNLLEYIKEI